MIQREIIFTVLIILKGCYPIPLPGVEEHAGTSDADISSFLGYSPLDDNPFEPSFRNVPIINRTTPVHIQDVASGKEDSTKNPLEKLLDRLYGSSNWRALLENSSDDKPILTTSLPLVVESSTKNQVANLPGFLSFFSNEISGSQFRNIHDRRETTVKPGTHDSNVHSTNGLSSKYMQKVVGNQRHGTVNVSQPSSQTGKHDENQLSTWSQMSMGDGTSSIFQHGQGMTQSPLPANPLDGAGNVNFQPGQANPIGINAGYQDYQAGGFDAFDPNKINNEQQLYQPSSSFSNFMTQTGSNPINSHIPVSYNADALNAGIPGLASATQAAFGGDQYGYRFSAYRGAEPHGFNANALNQALMESNLGFQQQPAAHMFMPGTGQEGFARVTPQPEVLQTVQSTPAPKVMVFSTPKPRNTFDFVPGNLFPGHDMQTGQERFGSLAQEASPPEFLRNIPMATGHEAFNPNLLNAAQNLYNPNAMSWIRTRDLDNISTSPSPNNITSENNEDVNSWTNILASNLTTIIPNTSVNSSESTPLSTNLTRPEGTSQSPISNKETSNGGFDPNAINSVQGQTDFVPGQIAPAFSGYMNDPYNQGQTQQNGGTNSGSGVSNGGYNPNNISGVPAMNFNFAELLGISAGMGTNGTNQGGYGQDIGSFNPNTVNNMMVGNFNAAGNNTASNAAGFGAMGYMEGGFDPKKANEGFANILGSQVGNSSNSSATGFGFGNGGFDPYAANAGFGAGGFGMGALGPEAGNNAYNTDFDPNKVNMMAIQNPFGDQQNSSGGNLMNYFLGIVSGNSGRKSENSAFIAGFDPDSVNQAVYDPNRYNQADLHLDPLEMLSNNPGMDKETLKAAASAFDPDKLNSPNMHQSFSPLEMLSNNPGMDKNVLSNLKYDPSATANVAGNSNAPGQNFPPAQASQGSFDPINLMAKLMQSAGAFQPGVAGNGKQSMDPSAMFGSLFGSPQSSSKPTSLSTSTLVPVMSTSTPVLATSQPLTSSVQVTPTPPATTTTIEAAITSTLDLTTETLK